MTSHILSALCREPEGVTIRKVYPMQLTQENLQIFWEKSKRHKTIFGQEASRDFKKFLEMFLSQDGDRIQAHGLFWVIDDFVGVYYMTHISEIEALVHYTFFDGRHLGREELTKEMLRYAFRRFGFKRLNVQIPMFASRNTFGFTKALGFTKEGRKRKVLTYKGQDWDVVQFGILKDEILKEETL